MELVAWIVVCVFVGVLAVVSMLVLVVGTWFVVMTVVLAVAAAAVWLLDQGWRVNAAERHDRRACRYRLPGA